MSALASAAGPADDCDRVLSGDRALGSGRVFGGDCVLGVRDGLSPGRASRGGVAVLASVLPGQLLVEPSVELMAFWELVDTQYGDPVPVFGGRVVDALDDVALVELIVQLEPDASLARARDTRCLYQTIYQPPLW